MPKYRIRVAASMYGTVEVVITDDDLAGRGINEYVDRGAEDWAHRALEEGTEMLADVDDLDVWDEGTGKWISVPD